MIRFGQNLLLPAILCLAIISAGHPAQADGRHVGLPGKAASAEARLSSRLIVEWRSGIPPGSQMLDGLDFVEPLSSLPEIDTTIVRVKHGSTAAARTRLLADSRIAVVSEDARVRSDVGPNDVLYPRQWALHMIQAPWAWELVRGGSNVIVGVLDSGIDLSHPDLVQHILPIGCNLVADKSCAADGQGTPPIDEDGHGSHVAGIVAASTDNREGIAGISWNASILPVKVTTGGNGVESDFIAGLIWAVDRGASVLNFSFSEDCGTPESSAMQKAIAYAWNHGAILVAAAGNGSGCPAGVFPAADPHVIAVASTDMNDRPSSFSNFGPWVRAAAPGEHIISTWANGQYSAPSGTSMAAPQVAGLAALLFSIAGATNTSVVHWVLSTCDIPDGWNPAYGCGRINAFRAASLAVRGSDPHRTPPAPVMVHLTRGLNNLLFQGPTRQVDVALAALKGRYGSVYAWDAVRSVWQAYLPGQPAASDLQLIEERGAYWIYMKSDADLTMNPTGTSAPPQLTLARGWNNLALAAGPLPATLQQFSDPVSSIFTWNAPRAIWNGFFSGKPTPSDLDGLTSNTAYWIFSQGKTVVHFDR